MTTDTQCKPEARSARFLIGSMFEVVWQWLRCVIADRAMRAAESELQMLNDRMLKDIGIHRSEIESMLRDVKCERRNSVGQRSLIA